MTKTMTIGEAQSQLAELLQEATDGIEVILTDGKTLRVRLVPLEVSIKKRVAGLHLGSMTTTDDFDAPLPEEFWTGKP
jgi:antitoxin (DNA-binding transcriptional repressor) of toxin-antitoxin stability system